MGRTRPPTQEKSGAFFFATLLLRFVSVWFEVLFNRRSELLYIAAASSLVTLSLLTPPSLSSTPPSPPLQGHVTLLFAVVFILVNEWLRNGGNGMFEHSQLFGGSWAWAHQAFCFSCGYFAYDQWDMLHYGLYSGFIPSILAHHLLLLICFTLALYRNVTINYLILTLVCELHSIFLHVRKIRRMAGVRDAKSNIVKAEWVLSWATFTLARVTSHVLITVKLILDAHKFGKGVELPLALLGMNMLNTFLGIDLFHACKREMTPQHTNTHQE